LDLIDGVNELEIPKLKLIEYIYSNQCQPVSDLEDCSSFKHNFGFFGGPYLGFDSFQNSDVDINRENIFYTGNLVYTFPALCCLLILGDDLKKVNKSAIVNGMKLLQNENGWYVSLFVIQILALKHLL
jgi:geranylgeranyl transferase type-1 subunit beta